MSRLRIEIEGLEVVKTSLNMNRISTQIAKGMGIAALKLHKEISHAVFTRYKTSKSLDSVLVGKSSSVTTFGKGILQNSLEYKFVPIDLSKFFSPPAQLGNINAGATRMGWIHSVEVIRGRRQISYGKGHRGGFIPRTESGVLFRNSRFGSQMFERIGRARLPLRVLYAPTLSQMANYVVNNDSRVIYIQNQMPEIIANEITF